jgi:protein-L-isoaspartate(D-aspartate) O-methyltransferase
VGKPADLVAAARAAGVADRRVLDAIAAVPRAHFVPKRLAGRAYKDAALKLPNDQVTTQPSLVAQVVAALDLRASDRVLEVGTGFGWQTALLACLADSVWTIERWPELAEAAGKNLQDFPNVTIVVGDGGKGLPEHAPYDAIVVTAAFPAVPRPLIEQLAEGGRLVQPLGHGGADDVVLFELQNGALQRTGFVASAHFVRLYGEHGFRA